MGKKLWLLLDGDLIVDIAETMTAPQGYVLHDITNYPNDLLTRTYRLVGSEIVRDETLYAEYLEQQIEG